MACRQIFVNLLSGGSNGENCTSPTHPFQWAATVIGSFVSQPWLVAGEFQVFGVTLSSAPGTGKSWTFTFVKNGVDTALTVTISDSAVHAVISGVVAVSAGDVIAVRRTSTGSPSASGLLAHITTEFHGTAVGVSGYGSADQSVSGTVNCSLFQSGGWTAAVVDWNRSIVGTGGTLTDLAVTLRAAPGGAASRTFVVYKNGVKQDGTGGTVNTTITITGAATTGSWSGTLTFAAGDQATLQHTDAGTPATSSASIGAAFQATTDGDSQWGGTVMSNLPTTATTVYAKPQQRDTTAWDAVAADQTVIHSGLTSFQIRTLRVALNALTAANDLTWTLLRNGSAPSGTPSAVIASGTTSGSDTTGTLTIAAGDSVVLRDAQAGSAGVSRVAAWGAIQHGLSTLTQTDGGETADTVDGDPGTVVVVALTDRSSVIHPYASEDLNDADTYEAGYKAPKLLVASTIRRDLSDLSGQISHPTFGAVLSDTDYEWRAALEDATQRYLTNSPITVKTVSDADRRAELPMHSEMCGFVADYTVRPDLQFEVTGMGWLKKKLAQQSRTPEFWVPLLSRDAFPQLPDGLIGKAAPLWYGRISDEIEGAPSLGADLYPRGNADPGWLVWGYDFHTGGTLPLGNYYVFGTTITNGVESQIFAFELGITMDALGGGAFYIQLKTAVTPDLYRFYVCDEGTFNPFTNPLAGTLCRYVDVAPADLVENPYGPPNNTKYTLIDSVTVGNDYHALVDAGSGASYVPPKGSLPGRYVGAVTLGGVTRSAFLIGRGAITNVLGAFINGVRQTSVGSATELEVPFMDDYATVFGANYVDLDSQRWTVAFATGQTALNAINGTAPLTFNIEGIEDVGDTTGELLTSPVRILQHFERNFLAADTVPDTTWLTTIPTLPSGLPMQDTASYNRADLALVDRLTGGYECAGGINVTLEAESAVDVIGSLCENGDFYYGCANRFGQSYVAVEPSSAPAEADVTRFDDQTEIVDRSFELSSELTQNFWNVLPFVDTQDYVGRTADGWYMRGEARDAASITNYQQERTAQELALRWSRNNTVQAIDTILDVMQRKRLRTRHPLRPVVLAVPYLTGAPVELGDVIRVNHIEGLGSSGWTDHDVFVTGIDTDLDRFVRLFRGYDLQPIYDGLDDAVDPTHDALGEQATVSDTLITLQQNVTNAQVDLATIEAEISTLDTEVSDHETRISTLETEETDHESRISALEGAGPSSQTLTFGIVLDGGGSAITTGTKGFVSVPVTCTITKWRVLSIDAAVTSGSIVVDVWKDTYANYPPALADSIAASAKPTLSSATKNEDSTLTGWTTAVTAGDVIGFHVDSVSTLTRVLVLLEATT